MLSVACIAADREGFGPAQFPPDQPQDTQDTMYVIFLLFIRFIYKCLLKRPHWRYYYKSDGFVFTILITHLYDTH